MLKLLRYIGIKSNIGIQDFRVQLSSKNHTTEKLTLKVFHVENDYHFIALVKLSHFHRYLHLKALY